MARLGADVANLDQLVQRFGHEAERMGTVGVRTTAMLAEAWWQGPDADRTRSWWREHGERGLREAAEWLERLGDELRRQAEDQRTASGLDGAGGGAASLPGRVRDWFRDRADDIEDVAEGARDWFGDRVEDIRDWGEERVEDVQDFGGERIAEARGFLDGVREGVEDVFDGEEDDDAGQSSGYGIPGPFDDWARGVQEATVDRGSTLLDYVVRTADRRSDHPLQTLVDAVTLTALAEDVTAGLQIVGGDAEIADTGDNDAVFLTNAWAPFEGGAITIGHTVSVNDTGVSDHLVDHELQHVYDLEDVGGLGFYGSYGVDFTWNWFVEGRTGPGQHGGTEAYEDIFWEQRGYGTDDPGAAPPEGIFGGIWKKIW